MGKILTKLIFGLFVCVAGVLFLASTTQPTWWIEFKWDANTEKDIAGYRVYYRKGDQPDFVCLGETDKDKTDCVVSELEPLVDHFFAVTAFDTGELESRLSDELKFRVEPWSPGEEDGCFIVTIRN